MTTFFHFTVYNTVFTLLVPGHGNCVSGKTENALVRLPELSARMVTPPETEMIEARSRYTAAGGAGDRCFWCLP